MIRRAASLVSLFGLAFAGPLAAQSFGLVAMPMVIVATPAAALSPAIVQGMRAPASDAAIAPFAAVHRGADLAPAAQPSWLPLPSVDRGLRDYRRGIAHYGPFVVLDSRRVALVGETDRSTPQAFSAMVRDFPQLAQLDMVECPGTRDDLANMKLGRMIRAAGLVTHVPRRGSVRSGAVELFFAGIQRDIVEGAEFAVHSWRDEFGREADDFSAESQENRKYLDYYREMGMSEREAHDFYDFTNSVPHSEALWLDAGDMRRWAGPAIQATGDPRAAAPQETAPTTPKLAYVDVTFS
ncbi:alpha/beta hydrolase [Qipengyuania zhejiangensis]|uniref:alpha/beta hydrolase n=1 Tax=Qipengyuania zhejiangensis TaxID=3077782 RepID=UPI002D772225|nr:alpha/beta hydrolase [Qipengyuania sp. Z2]